MNTTRRRRGFIHQSQLAPNRDFVAEMRQSGTEAGTVIWSDGGAWSVDTIRLQVRESLQASGSVKTLELQSIECGI